MTERKCENCYRDTGAVIDHKTMKYTTRRGWVGSLTEGFFCELRCKVRYDQSDTMKGRKHVAVHED